MYRVYFDISKDSNVQKQSPWNFIKKLWQKLQDNTSQSVPFLVKLQTQSIPQTMLFYRKPNSYF